MGTKKIKVLKDGPYQVEGGIPLNKLAFVPDGDGASEAYKKIETYPSQDTYHLCRCGKSKNKPFCDGTHEKAGFEGTETASHKTYEEMVRHLEGKQLDLLDAKKLCAVARFCDTYGSTWSLVKDGETEKEKEIAIYQSQNCPSGRLTAVDKDGTVLEPELPQEISILEDPAAAVHGPIWVKGSIPIEDENGEIYPPRNRVTLCRCGHSQNKPFCDARHMENQGELRGEIL